MRLIISILALVSVLIISHCTKDIAGSNDETVTGTISLSGKVLDSQNNGVPDVVVRLSKIPFLDSTNSQGYFNIFVSEDTLEKLGIDLDTLQDTLTYIKDSIVITSVHVKDWIDTLPHVYIVQRNVSGQLLTTYKEFRRLEAVLKDLDNPLIPSKSTDLWLSTNTFKFSGFLYFLNNEQIQNYSIYVNVYDQDSVFVGRSVTEKFNNTAGDIELLAFDPFNAFPYIDMGTDTIVSIGDSIFLHPTVADSFGGTIESWEWSINGDPFVMSAPGNRYVVAPVDSTSLFNCLLRVTDNDSNQTVDSLKVTVVLDAPVVHAGYDTTVSINDTVVLQSKVTQEFGTIIMYAWDFDGDSIYDDSSAITADIPHVFTHETIYNAVLLVRDDDGNEATDTCAITVQNLPPCITYLRKDTTISIYDTIDLVGMASDSDGVSLVYSWDCNGDGIIEYTDSSSGTTRFCYENAGVNRAIFSVSDDDNKKVADTVTITVLQDPPVATASTTTPLVSLFDTLRFQGTASDQFGSIVTWEWDVGNSGTFVAANSGSGHVVMAPASAESAYPIVLKVTDDDGNSDCDTVVVTVVVDLPVATASTTTPTVSVNDPIILHGTATDKYGWIAAWEWDIGNTGIFILANNDSGHTANAPATASDSYECVLRVTDNDGNVALDTAAIAVVADIPVATATTNTPKVSINDTLVLLGTASDGYGTIVAWEWDVGNTGSFTPANNDSGHLANAPSSAASSYGCVLRVTDNDGNTALDTIAIEVIADVPVPTASTATPKVSINDPITLQGTATDGYGAIVSWEWDVGNTGSFTPANNDSGHTANAPSTAFSSYECVLRVKDNDGNTALDTIAIEVVADIPVATASTITPTVSINDPISLQGTATDGYGTIVSWEWDIGNTGNFTSANNDSGHTTNAPSTAFSSYKCVLRVTDNDGNVAQDTVAIEVVADVPVAAASTTTPTVSINDPISLQGTATDGYGSILSWEWDIGNTGSFASANNDSGHTANAPSTASPLYQCVLRVTDNDGNTALDTIAIEVVADVPVATASTTTPTVSINDPISLQGTATDGYGTVVSWEWDIGNMGSFVPANTGSGHTANAPSLATSFYECVLRVTDNDGNTAKDTIAIEVVADMPVATASTTTPIVSINDPILLQGTATDGYGTIISWEWDVGNTGTFVLANNDSGHTTNAPTTASATHECVLKVTDDDGTIGLDTIAIEVLLDKPIAEAQTTTPTVTIHDIIRLQGSATDQFGTIATWEWKFGNEPWVETSSGDTNIIASSATDNFLCIFRVTDDDGVSGMDSVSVVISAHKGAMVYIQSMGKSFSMGNDNGLDGEKPAHIVTINRDFWVDTTEVTQKDYSDLMSSTYSSYSNPSWPSSNGSGDNCAAYRVNWFDAVLYCNARSKRDNLDTVYAYSSIVGVAGNDCDLVDCYIDYSKNGYRLPTEAEWEFACRAGTTSDYYWGDDTLIMGDYAWYSQNGGGIAHTVAEKEPNSFGLYDMSGNLWEWCNDWYTDFSGEDQTDPTGPVSGTERAHRGGSWFDEITTFPGLRSSSRSKIDPSDARRNVGFRVVLPILIH